MINRIILLLKGMAMGGADVIPGVSGGTIALITGIYDQLINSIRSIDASLIKPILKFQFGFVWQRVNGSFLVNVFAGVLISIFSLARIITYLLVNHPILIWSFFFGLIFISVYFVLPKGMTWKDFIAFVAGTGLAYVITSASPADTTNELWFIFVSGSIAICAMILPGISGSFILLLLGKYDFVLGAVKEFDLKIIAVFAVGCIVGIISFSKLIHWLLKHYRSVSLAVLSGFMLGSLNKIWPWKVDGLNVLPSAYEEAFNSSSNVVAGALLMLLGILTVVLLEWTGKSIQKR